MQGARAPRETPGPRGAHLAAAKARQKENQTRAACDALVPCVWFGVSLQVADAWLLSPVHLPGAAAPILHGAAAAAAAPCFSSPSSYAISEKSYCLPNYPGASDAMIKYFARPDPVSV